jgi:hypothetical protein
LRRRPASAFTTKAEKAKNVAAIAFVTAMLDLPLYTVTSFTAAFGCCACAAQVIPGSTTDHGLWTSKGSLRYPGREDGLDTKRIQERSGGENHELGQHLRFRPGLDELVPSRYALRVGEIDVLVISDGVLPIAGKTIATTPTRPTWRPGWTVISCRPTCSSGR